MAALEAKAAGALHPSTKKRKKGYRDKERRGKREEKGRRRGGNERGNVLW